MDGKAEAGAADGHIGRELMNKGLDSRLSRLESRRGVNIASPRIVVSVIPFSELPQPVDIDALIADGTAHQEGKVVYIRGKKLTTEEWIERNELRSREAESVADDAAHVVER
jgi:hypothetical protein